MDEVRIGRYTIVRPLGSGAFSTVYLARMEGEGPFVRQVAIKRLHRSATREPAVVRLLIHEAQIGGLMNHDNVVGTIDLLKVNDEYFLITEFVDGVDLGDLYVHLMEHQEVMSPGLVAELGHQICRGLSYIHELQDLEGRPLELVHRDLKPSNVLVHRSGRVKITDFGVVSARAKEQITARETIVGTPRYMSPEQVVAADVTAASDLYSLGVMLLQGLTSIVPLKMQYRRGRPVGEGAPDPEDLLLMLPAKAVEFTPLLRELLQPQPSDRPASADEVATELRRLRSVYPLQRPMSALVGRWQERLAEDLEDSSLEQLPSDRSGDYSVLRGADWQAQDDSTERRRYAGARHHPGWEESTDHVEETDDEATDLDEVETIPIAVVVEPSEEEEEPRRKRAWLWVAIPLLLLFVVVLIGVVGSVAGWRLLTSRPAAPPATSEEAVSPGPPADPSADPSVDALAEILIEDEAEAEAESESDAFALLEVGSPDLLTLTVDGQRRSLRNTTLTTRIDTGTSGCTVEVHWTVEDSGHWRTTQLSGDGPGFSWSLAVTAEHRPAILYYVEASGCGTASHASAAAPVRVVVR